LLFIISNSFQSPSDFLAVHLRQALAHTDIAGFHQRFGSFITQYDTQFDLRIIRSCQTVKDREEEEAEFV